MSEENQPQASGDNVDSSAANVEQENVDAAPKKDTVQYSTYQKVLSEKKRRDEQLRTISDELDTLRSQEKERVESEMKAKEDYKQLLDIRNKELEDVKGRFSELQTSQVNASKLNAFFDTLDGKVSRDYWDFVPINEIALDPDTGRVDEMSVQKAVEAFKAKHPRLIDSKAKPKPVMNAAPTYASGMAGKESRQEKLEAFANSGLFGKNR